MSKQFGTALLIVVLAIAEASACTGVALVSGGSVIAAGNEDNNLMNPAMWATAASETAHGAVYFGFYFSQLANRYQSWYEMQGVNDQGLYFDLFSTPCRPDDAAAAPALPQPGRLPEAIERAMLSSCATVSEALAFLHKKNYARILPCVQTLLVDRAGNAAVYTGKADVFRSTPGFVVTNFWLDDPSLGGWPCESYNAASRMILWNPAPTLENAAAILRAARYIPAPGASYEEGGTRYSIVCDLVGGVADVYLDGDFTKRARVDLAPLWANGLARTPLADLVFTSSGIP